MLLTGQGDPLESLFIGRPIEENSNSPLTLTRAANWVKNCDEHPECYVGIHPLPARVVDIGSAAEDVVRLCETDGQTGRYITLSHCWGSAKHFVTTRALLEARKSSIEYDELPRTFQDAIVVTRALGVRYLWIDSLCICQDDRDDWDRESAKMHSIYHNSYLTIAATTAGNSSVGCLTTRKPTSFVHINHTSKTGERGQLLAFPLPVAKEAVKYRYISMDGESLSTRAWGFQERVLPPRTLHFAKHQMYFECNQGILGENGLQLEDRYHSIHFMDSTISEPQNTLCQWQDAIREYGTRRLTMSSDKLPALSGIAQIFADRLGDEYVAGLWRKSLIDGLFWQGVGVRRVSEYRAPSWSWASVDGTPASGFWEPPEYVATIIDCYVELQGENPYGEVKSGWIKLQAPLEPLFLDENFNPEEASVPYDHNPIVRTANGNSEGVHSRFDFAFTDDDAKEVSLTLVQSLKNVSIFALILAKTEPSDNYGETCQYHALIVCPTGDDNRTMRRLGFVLLDDDDLGKCKSLDPATERPIVTLV
jgi:hypothetical protein